MNVVDWSRIAPTVVGAMESRTAQLGEMVVTRHHVPAGFDSAPYYRGLPNGMCPCEHLWPPGNRLERLKGERAGRYSIRINGQWRVCFRWERGNTYDVEIVDYH